MSQHRQPTTAWHASLVIAAIALSLLMLLAGAAAAQTPLDARALTKYVDPLPVPGAMPQAAPNYYEIGMWQIQQQLHRDLPPTSVWGYGPTQATASYPGATIEATRGVPIQVHWTNHLPMTHLLDYAIDPTLHMAMPAAGIPTVAHLHGGEVPPGSDGGPESWFTQGFAEKGSGWQQEVFDYPNQQQAATLWYHDHALGLTRLNVYAGLAGFYLLRDPANEPAGLPSGAYEIPIVIQDRMFTSDGQLYYPHEGDNPEHPIWTPEFFGDAIVVNGKVWPYLNVEPRKYRLRFLDGSDARFYSLSLNESPTGKSGPAMIQIGSDGGLLYEPVTLNDPARPHSPRLVIAPGERADVVVDFSGYAPGAELILKNTAKAPYPSGDSPDPQTTGQIMMFRVVAPNGPDDSTIPSLLANVERLSNPTVTRVMTLNEVMGEDGPLEALLNGLPWDAPETEQPVLGTTELWEVVNLTGDTHPIHIHLVQFQLLSRQKFNDRRYRMAFDAANPQIPSMSYTPVDPTPYLRGKPMPADPNERGWKDTFRMNPGEVTRVLVRWATQEGTPFSFDATAEPGYVWHCHILEHEDNEMMRPFHVVAAPAATASSVLRTKGFADEGAGAISLRSPVPNPAARSGLFQFHLPTAGAISVDLFDVRGRRVRAIASGWFEAGEHVVPWRRVGDDGRSLAGGVYFVRVRGEGVDRTQKLVLTP